MNLKTQLAQTFEKLAALASQCPKHPDDDNLYHLINNFMDSRKPTKRNLLLIKDCMAFQIQILQKRGWKSA